MRRQDFQTETLARPDEAAFAQLYRCSNDLLRRYLLRILRSEADAEDIAQEAFLKVHRASRAAILRHPKAVLFKTAYRLALNCIRQRRRNPLACAVDVPLDRIAAPMNATAEDQIILREERAALHRMLNDLSPRGRQILRLRFEHGLTYRQIADELGLSVSTLEKHMARSRRACTDGLADHAQRPLSRRTPREAPSCPPCRSR